MQNRIIERIVALRKEMNEAGVKAVVLPRTDAHLSEYISDHWHIVRYLSGFTGSAGTMVVTDKEALLWVDSRYFLQGAQQIEGTGIVLMKDGLPDTPSIVEYLCENLSEGDKVGVNGMLMSIDETAALRSRLNAAGIGLDVDFDPIDRVWSDRPALPSDKIFIHDEKYAGESASSKIGRILESAKAQGAQAYFTSALDEIAWLLNIRSNDVPCNPVATSFLYVAPEGSTLFVDNAKMTPEVREYLAEAGVGVAPYTSVLSALAALPSDVKVLLSGSRASGAIAHVLDGRYVKGDSPVALPKAVKNEVQIAGIRQAHLRDGVAMVRSLMEIERIMAADGHLTEMDVADILLKHRSKGDLYFDLSFESICGFGANGAIVHYTADETSNTTITKGNLLLIDSGANYFDGTTDITRTIAVGEPSADMRHDFTLVMKGHIAVATAIYPEGTRGAQLDALARMPLWKEGKSYLHGTGHGVGHFLNVHEGPQSIRLNDTLAHLTPGMLTSNEPGVYLADRYGIRCENLVLTIPYEETEFGKFYAFETITLCPFDRALFDTSIMSAEEIKWVDDYHKTVYDRLAPLMEADEREWLAAATAPLNN
ncbi:MAG: aminopeptidase P family protein [Duncaniella sp.]|uniref:aminopeptidase P family protein n=1 Tax=Duncaniella sp. TaxID=2518496 RepID=UPI0023BB21AC|nr:aminopeptidase P family protein [Duncaniella sp.]MDE5988267.1 aminopeptidase P family protein [Duncaniella sp.]